MGRGSECQAAGWGYPCLTAASPCPASSVNEIPSHTQCPILSAQLHFLHSSPPSPLTLTLKYIFTPVLLAAPPPHLIFLSETAPTSLNYFFISYLTLSTLSSNLPGGDVLRPADSTGTPAQILCRAPACDTIGYEATCRRAAPSV